MRTAQGQCHPQTPKFPHHRSILLHLKQAIIQDVLQLSELHYVDI